MTATSEKEMPTKSGSSGEAMAPRSLAEVIRRPALDELRNEGSDRDLNTDTHTVRAGDICPSQGERAASGFTDQLR